MRPIYCALLTDLFNRISLADINQNDVMDISKACLLHCYSVAYQFSNYFTESLHPERLRKDIHPLFKLSIFTKFFSTYPVAELVGDQRRRPCTSR